MEENRLLSESQIDFKLKHSTSTALIAFTDQSLETMDKGRLTGAVFLDLPKAFDTVDYLLSINKLNSGNLRLFYLGIFGNFGNFWELLEILDPFYPGIFGNFWELIGILDPFNLGNSGNFWELLGILDPFYLGIFGYCWES